MDPAYEHLLAQYDAAIAMIDEAMVACEAKMTRTAVQKSLHAVQDVFKIDRVLKELKIDPTLPRRV